MEELHAKTVAEIEQNLDNLLAQRDDLVELAKGIKEDLAGDLDDIDAELEQARGFLTQSRVTIGQEFLADASKKCNKLLYVFIIYYSLLYPFRNDVNTENPVLQQQTKMQEQLAKANRDIEKITADNTKRSFCLCNFVCYLFLSIFDQLKKRQTLHQLNLLDFISSWMTSKQFVMIHSSLLYLF